jgi:hypothetical protein
MAVADVQQQLPSSFIAFLIFATGDDVAGRSTAFNSYNLESAIGPINTSSPFGGFNVDSTLGAVGISNISNLSFTATSTPEPRTFLLLGAALLIAFSRKFACVFHSTNRQRFSA